MTISRDTVIWGFRFFLQREPGSEEAIEAHMKLKSSAHLAEALLKSREFAIARPFGKLLTVNHTPRPPRDAATNQAPPLRILLLGNCQVWGLSKLLQAMVGNALVKACDLTAGFLAQIESGELDLNKFAAEHDLAFMHPHSEAMDLIGQKSPALRGKLKLMPPVNFSAFHPDLVYIRDARQQTIQGPLGEYQSSIAFYGWKHGLTIEKTVALFEEDVFEHLGFFEYEQASRQFLVQLGEMTGIELEPLVESWSSRGCWMHSINHPKVFVLADVARALLAREGIVPLPGAEQYVQDGLASGPAWPVYPEIGKRLGLTGSYLFKKVEADCSVDMPVQMLDLRQFVQASFQVFSQSAPEQLVCERLATQPYLELEEFLATRGQARSQPQAVPASTQAPAAAGHGGNPYRGLPDHQFWRRGVEQVRLNEVDPVVQAGFALTPADKIATAGSCFAQHISRTLQKNGCNYYVAEQSSAQDAVRRNFGVFSARFGNIYTARQLVQLFDRADGRFEPVEESWLRDDGRFVDPFRPQVEPDGFATLEELQASRAQHFAAVRAMFESLDVFVFTLGLTEAWRSRQDGAVYPLAPGVAGGTLDPQRHEFVNFGVADVVSDLDGFIVRLLGVNPRARMIVTVSPVPLIATYEPRHVLASTTYSKSVLRAAAEEVCQRHAMCKYFPSYEVITGSFNRGAYFDDDLRSVKPEGVEHVMRLFTSHYFGRRHVDETHLQALMTENSQVSALICDEEAIDRQAASPPRARGLGRIAGKLKSLAGLSRAG